MIGALFVYGTLMRGERNHSRLAAASRIERGSTSGRLYALPEGYPALIVAAGPDLVEGELFCFDAIDAVLADLDPFEGYDPADPEHGLFVRRVVPVRTETNRAVDAYAYVMPEAREARLQLAGATRIETGRWSSRHLSATSE